METTTVYVAKCDGLYFSGKGKSYHLTADLNRARVYRTPGLMAASLRWAIKDVSTITIVKCDLTVIKERTNEVK